MFNVNAFGESEALDFYSYLLVCFHSQLSLQLKCTLYRTKHCCDTHQSVGGGAWVVPGGGGAWVVTGGGGAWVVTGGTVLVRPPSSLNAYSEYR